MGHAMADKDRKPFSTTMGLMRRTTPFLILNAVVYAGFFLAIVAWLGVFGFLAVFFSSRVEILAFVFMMIAIFGPGGILMFARRYLLYLMQGAHIAVATKLLIDGQIPDGKGQIAYGRDVVKQRFIDVSVLFALDRAIHGVVKTITRTFVRIVDMLPLGGGASNVARIGASIINRSLSYIDEAILSYAIARDSDNVWQSGRHGVILYAQAYKPILGAAVKIWLIGRVIFLAVLIVLALAAVPVVLAVDVVWFQVTVVVGTLLLAALIVRAVFEPFAAIYTLVTYHRAIEGVEVNAVWDQRLQGVSKRFREIVGKAQEQASAPDPLDQTTVPPAALQPGADAAGVPASAQAATPPLAAPGQQPAPPPGGPQTAPQQQGGSWGAAGSFASMSRGGGRGALGGIVGGAVAQAASGISRAVEQQRAPGPGQPPATDQPPGAPGAAAAPWATTNAPADPPAPPPGHNGEATSSTPAPPAAPGAPVAEPPSPEPAASGEEAAADDAGHQPPPPAWGQQPPPPPPAG